MIEQIKQISKISHNEIKHLKLLDEHDFNCCDNFQLQPTQIESIQKNASNANTILFDNLRLLEISRSKKYAITMYKADRHNIESIDIDLSQSEITFEIVYIPIFVFEHWDMVNSHPICYFKFINGFNGMESMDYIPNYEKIALWSLFNSNTFVNAFVKQIKIFSSIAQVVGIILIGTFGFKCYVFLIKICKIC